jgi:hypothetical protein
MSADPSARGPVSAFLRALSETHVAARMAAVLE